MLPWVLAGCSLLSALAAASSLLLIKGKSAIDQETLKKLRREQETEDEARDRKRREEDERRNAERVAADEHRNQMLREELDRLARTSNNRFKQWQDAISDLDELWGYVERHVPWDREAFRKLAEAEIPISDPPALGRRHHQHRIEADFGDDDDDDQGS